MPTTYLDEISAGVVLSRSTTRSRSAFLSAMPMNTAPSSFCPIFAIPHSVSTIRGNKSLMVGRPDLPEADRRAVAPVPQDVLAAFPREPSPIRRRPSPVRPRRAPRSWRKAAARIKIPDASPVTGNGGDGDGPPAPGLKDYWGWATRPSDLTWRPLKRGSSVEDVYLTIATGLSGTPMPHTGGSLDGEQIWSLVYYLDALVPPAHRLAPRQSLGEEARGWMALRMGRMMGG